MKTTITREQALELLLKYNKDSFHLEHALTVEGVMGCMPASWAMATKRLSGAWQDFYTILTTSSIRMSIVRKRRRFWQEINAGEDLTHAVCSHGYGLVSDVKPEHEMEKVLFAADELTG